MLNWELRGLKLKSTWPVWKPQRKHPYIKLLRREAWEGRTEGRGRERRKGSSSIDCIIWDGSGLIWNQLHPFLSCPNILQSPLAKASLNCFVFVSWGKVSCSPGWPRTFCVAKVDLEFLLLPFKCHDCRPVPLCLDFLFVFQSLEEIHPCQYKQVL